MVEGEKALTHVAGRGDDHHGHQIGLQYQHLDVAHGGRCNRRPGDHAHEVGDLRDSLAQASHRLIYLNVHQVLRDGSIDSGTRCRQRSLRKQLIHVVAVAHIGGHPAGRGVRVFEITQILQPVKLVPNRGRRPLEIAMPGNVLAAHRLAAGDVALHHRPQDLLLARGQRRLDGVGGIGHAKSMSCCTTAF